MSNKLKLLALGLMASLGSLGEYNTGGLIPNYTNGGGGCLMSEDKRRRARANRKKKNRNKKKN